MNRKTAIIRSRVTPELARWIARMAKREDRTVSEYVRELFIALRRNTEARGTHPQKTRDEGDSK